MTLEPCKHEVCRPCSRRINSSCPLCRANINAVTREDERELSNPELLQAEKIFAPKSKGLKKMLKGRKNIKKTIKNNDRNLCGVCEEVYDESCLLACCSTRICILCVSYVIMQTRDAEWMATHKTPKEDTCPVCGKTIPIVYEGGEETNYARYIAKYYRKAGRLEERDQFLAAGNVQ